MSIKSDRWIRRQCEQPIGHVHVTFTDINNVQHKVVEPVYSKEDYATFNAAPAKEEVARKLVGNGTIPWAKNIQSCEFQRHFHSEDFKPMIEPYEPGQVKEHERLGTDEEYRLTIGHADLNQALKHFPPSVKGLRVDPVLGLMVRERMVSYGTSSYGYDVRCADEFKVFTNINSTMVDPKNFDPKCFVDIKGPKCIIPPNSFALARTVEYFRIPRNVLTVCLGKSTYARCGIIVNVTPFEPEWEGYVTLEFSNTTPLPAVIYANEGCAQVLFFESDEDCEVSYKDRNGKYQGQAAEPVPPQV